MELKKDRTTIVVRDLYIRLLIMDRKKKDKLLKKINKRKKKIEDK